MMDIATGPFGAALIGAAFAGLALMVFLAAANMLFGLSDAVRRYGAMLVCALLAGFPAWVVVFYGSMLFYADFNGDWRGVALTSVLAAFGCWLFGTAIFAIRRILRLESMSDL